MKSGILALILVMLMIPCLASAEEAISPERIYIHLVIDGESVSPPGSTKDGVGAYVINDVLYLPAGVIPVSLGQDVSFDEETNTLFISTNPESALPGNSTGATRPRSKPHGLMYGLINRLNRSRPFGPGDPKPESV